MNILYIDHYVGSPNYGMEFRPYHLAREWIKKGHRVRMAGASFSHVRAKQPLDNGETIRKRTIENIDGIEYVWYPAPSYSGNGLGRIVNIIVFLARLYLDSNRTIAEFKPDVVIASSTYPMDIWVANHVAKKADARLVYEIHDPWPLIPMELGGMSAGHPFIRICQKAENDAFKLADVVVSIWTKMRDYVAEHGFDLNRFYTIPNGVVVDDWSPEKQNPLTNIEMVNNVSQLKSDGKIIVGFAGAHGTANALEYLIQAAEQLRNEPFAFIFVGTGLEKENLQRLAADLKLDNVWFYDQVPKTQILALLQLFDIAFLGTRDRKVYRLGASLNKLADYMMAKKVVLYSSSVVDEWVTESGCGKCVLPEDSHAIAEGLRELGNLSAAEREAMGEKGKEFILKNYTTSKLAELFLSAMAK
jgi:glycosyltransferase involved in cell wall biosynthesis